MGAMRLMLECTQQILLILRACPEAAKNPSYLHLRFLYLIDFIGLSFT